MSRIPQPSTRSSASLKPPSTPSKSRVATASTPRARTQSGLRSTTPVRQMERKAPSPPPPTPSLSIKEAIALKRAEARKALSNAGGGGLDNLDTPEDALPTTSDAQEDEDILGRLSVRDTIERARSTGTLNLATRSLPCLPSALFEMHLNVTPESLKSVPNEPALPPSEANDSARSKGGSRAKWFEAQDLTVLKAWNNEIQEIQHEISLFGSLKTLDLHKNNLTSLPNTICDLSALTVLDLSHNSLTALPDNIFALPELTALNISHNLLTSLPFNAPFKSSNGRRGNQYASSSFFTPAVNRAITPLPHLVALDASYNKIIASGIDETVPVSLSKIDLSGNPLGPSQPLLRVLGLLKRLKELRMEKAEIGDDSFPSTLFPTTPFVILRLFDLSETQANLDVVQLALQDMTQELNFDFTTDDPPVGVTRVLVGKRVIKEAWELEMERRATQRVAATSSFGDDWSDPAPTQRPASRASKSPTPTPKAGSGIQKPAVAIPKTEVVKEVWEIEAEQGLLTEGGRRRARAQAAAAAQNQTELPSTSPVTPAGSPDSSSPSSISTSSLTNPQYFTQNTQTLRLPASTAPTKSMGHARTFSLALPSGASAFAGSSSRTGDLSVPTPTLPLSVILAQPFAQTLRVLILANRRMDRSFALPSSLDSVSGFLPCLEELDLEGCNLGDLVSVYRASESGAGSSTPPRSNELVIPTLAGLFPGVRTLNLSYNGLTNLSLGSEGLSNLILTSPHRQGLRHLHLRGNRLTDLDGFLGLAESFKGNRDVPGWKLEELDLRDNEIGKLPPELGLLPLDVFLVDGNTFRVPQRRVWEREGTKGLLSWLRGRIE